MNAMQWAKAALRRTPLRPLYQLYRQQEPYRQWVRAGKPAPPPAVVKRRIIKRYARQFRLPVLVETGTFMGDTVEAMRKVFGRIYSIELSNDLFTQAQQRFVGAAHITILQGDSGEVLPGVLRQIQQPCLFWLDGHYSAGPTAKGALDTPIMQELSHIFRHPLAHRHVILIDDARLFVGKADYPTMEALRTTTQEAGFDTFEVEDDIIRILNSATGDQRATN